jgi:hypothetical protein
MPMEPGRRASAVLNATREDETSLQGPWRPSPIAPQLNRSPAPVSPDRQRPGLSGSRQAGDSKSREALPGPASIGRQNRTALRRWPSESIAHGWVIGAGVGLYSTAKAYSRTAWSIFALRRGSSAQYTRADLPQSSLTPRCSQGPGFRTAPDTLPEAFLVKAI